MIDPRRCAYSLCQAVFQPKRATAEYCSSVCRVYAYRDRQRDERAKVEQGRNPETEFALREALDRAHQRIRELENEAYSSCPVCQMVSDLSEIPAR